MRSGNGRHRRPRQAPALFVAAGVTGAGIAIPLLGAGSAQAADASTWDRVAQCESGGEWTANAANGRYGGLQLTLQAWEEHGGTDYAERPDLASRGEQIAIAEEILFEDGLEAFPSCAKAAGLTDGNGKPRTSEPSGYPAPADPSEPSAPPSSGPSDGASDAPSTPSGPSDKPSEKPSEKPSAPSDKPSESPSEKPSDPPSSELPTDPSDGPVDPADPSQPAGQPAQPGGDEGWGDGEDGTDTGKGKHRGQPDDRESPQGEHPSRGGERDHGGKHRVRAGDSLSQIAADQDIRGGWTALYERNRDVVGDDPDLILPGQDLRL